MRKNGIFSEFMAQGRQTPDQDEKRNIKAGAAQKSTRPRHSVLLRDLSKQISLSFRPFRISDCFHNAIDLLNS